MSQATVQEPHVVEAGSTATKSAPESASLMSFGVYPRQQRPSLPKPQSATTVYKMYGDLAIFSGTAHPELAKKVADYLQLPLGGADIFQFANTNTFVRLHESVRGKDVFLIQPTSPPTNDNLMELLIFIDTLRRDSAGRITAVVPYYGYGRTDKKDQPRVPITARLVADLITIAGADRFLTFDLHAGQVQGFFTIPTDELPTVDLFVRHLRQQDWATNNTVVVSPDIGGVKRARDFAERLELPLAIIEKRRVPEGRKAQMFNVIGDVKDRNVLIVDDEIDTAGTLTKAARFLRDAGAQELYTCATHAILSKPAAKRIAKSDLLQILVTDTVPIPDKKWKRVGERVQQLSVAPLLGDVIQRIHEGRSVGELFD